MKNYKKKETLKSVYLDLKMNNKPVNNYLLCIYYLGYFDLILYAYSYRSGFLCSMDYCDYLYYQQQTRQWRAIHS